MNHPTHTQNIPPNGFRTFLILWITQSFSLVGSSLTFFATTIWMTSVLYPRPDQKGELAWALSAVSIARMFPFIFGSPFAGAWADRHDRKRTMMGMDLAAGILSVIWAGMLVSGTLELWSLIVLTVLFSLTGAYHFAAFDASYVMLVEKEQLPRANGMMQTSFSLSNIVAPGLAAAIIALPGLARNGRIPSGAASVLGSMDGTALVILLDAVTFLIAAAVPFFLFVPSPSQNKDNVPGSTAARLWDDIRVGAVYIWRRRPLLWLLGTFTIANLAHALVSVILPLLVKFQLAPDWTGRGFTFEAALALISSSYGVGGFVGGIVISMWGGLRQRRALGVVVPVLITALALPVLGLSPRLYLTGAMIAVAGFMSPVMSAHSQSIWQNQTPPELQGRVFSVRRVLAMGSMPLGMAAAGWLAGAFDLGNVLTILGVVMTVFCVAQMFNRSLLRVDDREWLESLAAEVETRAGKVKVA